MAWDEDRDCSVWALCICLCRWLWVLMDNVHEAMAVCPPQSGDSDPIHKHLIHKQPMVMGPQSLIRLSRNQVTPIPSTNSSSTNNPSNGATITNQIKSWIISPDTFLRASDHPIVSPPEKCPWLCLPKWLKQNSFIYKSATESCCLALVILAQVNYLQ